MGFFDDDFDDVMRMMDKLFGTGPRMRKYLDFFDYDESERIIDGKRVYYTLAFKKVEDEEEIDVKSFEDKVEIYVATFDGDNPVIIKTPGEIIPGMTEWCFNNGLLDMTVYLKEELEDDLESVL